MLEDPITVWRGALAALDDYHGTHLNPGVDDLVAAGDALAAALAAANELIARMSSSERRADGGGA